MYLEMCTRGIFSHNEEFLMHVLQWRGYKLTITLLLKALNNILVFNIEILWVDFNEWNFYPLHMVISFNYVSVNCPLRQLAVTKFVCMKQVYVTFTLNSVLF